MIVFFYEKVRLKRGVWQTVSIVLLIAFLCAFFTLFDGFICQKEQDMESAYAVIPVTVVVSNLTGTKTDDLKMNDSGRIKHLRKCLEKLREQEAGLSAIRQTISRTRTIRRNLGLVTK